MSYLCRRTFLKGALVSGGVNALPFRLQGAGVAFDPTQNLIAAPGDPAMWPAFREQLIGNRRENRQKLQYKGDYYSDPAYSWAATNFNCCFVMMCDETFYDAKSGRYTLDGYLDRGEREFGGYDSIVLWHAYPRIGVDPRNQFDFYRDMPGGIAGVRGMVAAARKRGVHVYINYNPWDLSTLRETEPDQQLKLEDPVPGSSHTPYSAGDVRALAEMVNALNVDGIFLDTMPWAPPGLREALDRQRAGIIFEGEMPLHLEHIADHHGSWAQGQKFMGGGVPGVLRNKWFERRHMLHMIERWTSDHSAELQTAWMNGTGMMVWENVFGTWIGWSPCDRAMLSTMVPIQRRFSELFNGERWTPLVPTLRSGVFASLWEGDGLRLWTLVNRNGELVEGALLETEATGGQQHYDLIAGRRVPLAEAGKVVLTGTVPAGGIGCFLTAAPSKTGGDFGAFLKRQASQYSTASISTTSPLTETKLKPPPAARAKSSVPEGMVEVPAAIIPLTIEFQSRECGGYEGSRGKDPNFKAQNRQTRTVQRRVEFRRFAIDVTPVTNAEYARFLHASGYKPRHPENFLKHWSDGRPPAGREQHPVVYVDLEDARAYARWVGKRLPTEEEWQYAAQGKDGRKWPWGAEPAPDCCNDGKTGGTTPVQAFPKGRSPFGCLDMCGNVWQWTESERSDGRTRFAMIRGGGWFNPTGSGWYVSGGPKAANYSTKFLLMWPGLDRCSTIGFRCVVELA